MARIYPSSTTRAYVVVSYPMPVWRRTLRWLLRRPTADIYPVEINPPADADTETVTFTVDG